jgi:hypothetical protein
MYGAQASTGDAVSQRAANQTGIRKPAITACP